MSDELKRELVVEGQLRRARKEAASLTRQADWEKADKIENDHAKERRVAEKKYHRDYDKRLIMAAKHLAKRHGEDWDRLKRRKDPHSRHLARYITAKSKREVEHDHRRRITTLKEREATSLFDLIQSTRDRENGPQPSEPPKRITDQRDESNRVGPYRKR